LIDCGLLSKLIGMANPSRPAWRFVSFAETEIEKVPPGKTHYWYCKPGMVADTNLLLVRAHLEPGAAHKFHYHPRLEEILFVLSGTAEQWVEREKKVIGPGDSVYLPAGIVHGTYNIGSEPLDFLAILAPAKGEGPITVEVSDQEPWRSLRG
jgi:quercetin dioxygenase-like cupin family protein